MLNRHFFSNCPVKHCLNGQALEAAQWVKLTSPGADLTIYAGDFNTEPGDVPYRILRYVA